MPHPGRKKSVIIIKRTIRLALANDGEGWVEYVPNMWQHEEGQFNCIGY